jgi:hypothetical protein
MHATIQQTKTGKLILHVCVDEGETEKYLLQNGKQPEGIFTIIVHARGA